ncbi:MAG: restriction endonuclease subunit S [Paludibacteraceae bacterium]|nr:restriction endonuclease subunit S [Paludibacteraceae bacterium]
MNKWKTYRLGEICDLVAGFAFKSNHFGNYANQVIKIADIQPPIVKKELMGVDLSTYDTNKLKKYIVSKGDFVLAMTGATIGKIGRVTNDTKAYINQRVLTFRPNPLIIDKSYLYYLLSVEKFNKYILNHIDSETAQPNISANSIGGYEISLPPLAEQKRIADILSVIDDKIELNRRINANLEQQAQALFDEIMSCELEYDLIANIPHVIETGKRPKGGVASITSGIPSIGAENIKGLGYYDYSKTKYITEEFATTLKKGFVNGYELLIYKDGGKPGYFIPNFSIFGNGFPYNKMALNEHVFLLDFMNKGYNFFAYFYFQQEKIMRYLNAQGSKAAIPGINRNDIENISIPTIQNKVIQDFCRQTENIITHILNNASESRKLSIVRDALLPKLISGKIKI